MKKAVIITVYGKIEYLNRFIAQLLSDRTTDVFIHLDKKHDDLKPQILNDEHVHFVEHNKEIEWGGYSFLFSIIQSWREVVDFGKFDWIILCSGQDILVKKGLDDYLNNHPHTVFIDSWEDDRQRRAFLLHKWPNRYFRIIDTKFSITRALRVFRIRLFRSGLPIATRKVDWDVDNMTFYKNWFWSCIPYEVIEWIVDFINENPNYLDVFKGFVAEEGFIATTIMQSPYKDWLKFDSKGKSHSLTFRKESVNNHPPVLTKNDIELIDRANCFFARKIDDSVDNEIVEHYLEICKAEDY